MSVKKRYRLQFKAPDMKCSVSTALDAPIRANCIHKATDKSIDNWAVKNDYFGSVCDVMVSAFRSVAGRDFGLAEWRGVCLAAEKASKVAGEPDFVGSPAERAVVDAIERWNQSNKSVGTMKWTVKKRVVGFKIVLDNRYTVLEYWGGEWV